MIKNTLFQKLFYIFSFLCFGAIFVIHLINMTVLQKPLYQEIMANGPLKKALLLFTLIGLFGLIALFFLFKWARKKFTVTFKNPLLIAGIIFAFSMVTKLAFMTVIKPKLFSDFQLFFWVTAELSDHTSRYLSQDYFKVWAYQVGFPTAMAPIARLFNNQVTPLIVANCIFMSVTNSMVYLIARNFIKEHMARLGAFVYALLPLGFALSTVYTNQHLAMMFFYIGIWVLVSRQCFSIPRAIGAGLLFALGNMVRPEAITLLLSLISYVILLVVNKDILQKGQIKAHIKKLVIPVVCTIVVYFAGMTLLSQYIIASGINPAGLENYFPLYKFVVGFNPTTQGTYSAEDAQALFESKYYLEHPDARDEVAKGLIKERLSVGPKAIGKLFFNKTRMMWSNDPRWYPAFQKLDAAQSFTVMNMEIPVRAVMVGFTLIDDLIYIALFLLCLLATFSAILSKENHRIHIWMTMLFMVNYVIYLTIEVQHRYSMFAMPALLLIALAGMNFLVKKEWMEYPTVQWGLKLWRRYEEILMYLIFGVLTTLINFIVYVLATDVLNIHFLISNALAFVVAVLFAFITNKLWVFKEKDFSIGKVVAQFIPFMGARLFSFGMDMGIMFVFVDLFHFNDLVIKILSNVLVIILNYIASKFFIFVKREDK